MPSSRINLSSALVYIAGVEVPALDVAVSYGTDALPKATITLAATEELIRFGEEDRVPVAIFYFDQWYSKDGPGAKVDPQYRLLFDGDIIGWAYTKNASGDMVVFSCESHLAAMQQMRGYFLTGTNYDHSVLADRFLTGEQAFKADVQSPGFPNNLFFKGLFPGVRPDSSSIKRPIDFVANMVYSMKIGGYSVSSAYTSEGLFTEASIQAINTADSQPRLPSTAFDTIRDKAYASPAMSYFITYSHKTCFDRRWVATSFEKFVNVASNFTVTGDTQFTAIQHMALQRAGLKAVLGTFSSHSNYLEILRNYYGIVQYEVLAIPTAPFVGVETPYGKDAFLVKPGGAHKALANFISKPITPFAIAPQFNVLFSSMVTTFTFNESYLDQATRYLTQGNPSQAVRPAAGSETPGVDYLFRVGGVSAWPPAAYPANLSAQSASPFGSLLYPEEFFRGPVIYNDSVPGWYYYSSEALSSIVSSEKEAVATKNTTTALLSNKSSGSPDLSVDFASSEKKLLAESISVEPTPLTPAQKVNFAPSTNPSDVQALLQGYTRQKYFEARYRYRSGMSSTVFNPYILPSYPMVFIDGGNAGVHVTAVVTSVTHSFSAFGGASTSINFIYGRTLKEMYEEVISMKLDGKVTSPYMAAPVLPYVSQANEFQLETNAALHYKTLFYQGEGTAETAHATAFIASKFFQTQDLPGFARAPTAALPKKDGKTKIVSVELKLRSKYTQALQDHDVALRQVARPICTLAEYISFINRGQTTQAAMLQRGTIAKGSYGVEVPVYIRDYKYSSTVTSEDSSEDPQGLEGYRFPGMKVFKDVDQALAQATDLRRDWVKRLKLYRKKIYLKTVMGA